MTGDSDTIYIFETAGTSVGLKHKYKIYDYFLTPQLSSTRYLDSSHFYNINIHFGGHQDMDAFFIKDAYDFSFTSFSQFTLKLN